MSPIKIQFRLFKARAPTLKSALKLPARGCLSMNTAAWQPSRKDAGTQIHAV
jgi:hypothetical protein